MIKSFCTLFLIGVTITLHAAFLVEDAETGWVIYAIENQYLFL